MRLVIGRNAMTFEGTATNWKELPILMAKVKNRKQRLLEMAWPPGEFTREEFTDGDYWVPAAQLADLLGIPDRSISGERPLGSKGSSTKSPSTEKPQRDARPEKPADETRSGNSVGPSPALDAKGIDVALRQGDLTVEELPDGRFKASVTIRNPGDKPMPMMRVHFYAGDPQKEGRLLASHDAGPVEPRSGWREHTHSFDLKEGEKEVFVVVDATNAVKEPNEANNHASARVRDSAPTSKPEGHAGAKVDVGIRQFLVHTPDDGRPRAVVIIENLGTVSAPAIQVHFYAGDPDKGGRLFARHGTGPILPGKTWAEMTGLDRLRDGENELFVVIDPDDAVKESNETNNRGSTKRVRDSAPASKPAGHAGAKVDVGIRQFLTLTSDDGRPMAGVIIENLGTVSAPAMLVHFYAGDPDKGGRLLPAHRAGPIMPGKVWSEAHPLDGLRDGEDQLFVVIDPDDVLKESDETNNKASQVIPGRQSKHKTESAKVDIAIGDNDLIVTKLSDRLFEAEIPIRNKGSVPLPSFGVHFYAGDPDKGGRLLSHPSKSAGPIMPGGSWLEATHPHQLRSGEDTISVVLDPDNRVEESDETNNKASQTLSKIVSESENVDKVGAIRKLSLSGDDILQVEAQASEGFNFPYYLFIPGGIDKHRPVHVLVEPNNSGVVSDDLEVHRAKALTLVKRSHANRMAQGLGVPLLVPTFPRPRSNWLAYTHALDIDTLEIAAGNLKRVDLQLTAMIKHAQELLRTNGFAIEDRIFMHGFSASAKFCNRYSYLHPEIVKAAAAGGVNGLPTLPVREWNGYELPFPIGIAGIEKFTGNPFSEKAFGQVAHFIYMGSSDTNDTLPSREASGTCEAWREEEADIIRKALAADKMMPDRWELSRKIYGQQKLHAQLVTYNGVGHSIQGQMLDDVIDFFKANAGEKHVLIEPYEYPSVDPDNTARRSGETNNQASARVRDSAMASKPEGHAGAKVDVGIRSFSAKTGDDDRSLAVVIIENFGTVSAPAMQVYFYAGNPDKGGRLFARHATGPILPGKTWGEGTGLDRLRDGEDELFVVIDPDDAVRESNETNNRSSTKLDTSR
ncbi:MAG: hypothetical protein H8E44_41135 [Planctomycetes bacterium]|nr:hypothetical protein [Planctomycetota bacterium]